MGNKLKTLPIKPIKITCNTCKGKKEVYGDSSNTGKKIKCPNCNGKGIVKVKRL